MLKPLLIIKAEAASCIQSLGFRTREPGRICPLGPAQDLAAAVRSLPPSPGTYEVPPVWLRGGTPPPTGNEAQGGPEWRTSQVPCCSKEGSPAEPHWELPSVNVLSPQFLG